MSETLRPYFWIRRNADTYVPLIPVDELPRSIGLRGISTTKNWEDVCQGEMRFLGDHYDYSGQHYVVDFHNSTANAATSPLKVFRAPDKKDAGPRGVRTAEDIGSQDADQIQANIDHITSSQEDSPEGSQEDSQDGSRYLATAGTLGKKVYCTYWIRTGNCNYMQEGCKYKHEIPPDDETRLAIGVRTYPTWPREDPTPPPRPVKAWQGPKTALQQSWRRQDAQDPQAEVSGPQNGANRPDASSTPAPSSTHPQSGPSQPMRKGFKPSEHPTMPSTPQPATNPKHVSQQQSHGQATTSGFVNGKGSYQAAAPTTTESFSRQSAHIASHIPHNQSASTGANARQSAHTMQPPNGDTQTTAPPQGNGNSFTQRASQNSPSQTNSNGPSKGSLNYQFGQTPRDQNHGQTSRFAFGTNGSAKISSPSIDNSRPANPPPYMPTHTQAGQSEGTRSHCLATLSYDNHPFANSSSTHCNPSTIMHGNDPASSSSRVNTPATTHSNAPPTSGNSTSVDNNVHAAVDSDFGAGTPTNVNGHPFGKLSGNAPSFFGGNGSVRAQTPASVNGSVFGKSNTRFQNPFSPALCSPPPFHRRMFCEPGQAEYVANSIEDVHNKPQRTTKKHNNGSVHGKGKLHGGKGSHVGKGLGHGKTQARSQVEDLLA